MRQGMGSPSAAAALVLLLALLAGVHCREAQLDAAAGTENYTASDAAVYWGPWQRARATWYGQPNGAGPDDNGGACGFKHTNQYPFMSMGSCGNQPLFKDGKGCGSCYKEGPVLLRADGDGDHHRHELLPGVQVPLRPQRHGVRQAGQARPQRQAPPLRHHRHRVHQGAVRVPRPEDRVPRRGVLEPRLLRGAGRVRGRRRRRGAGGPDGVQDGARPADGAVDADARVLGLRLAHGHQPPHAGALLHPHPQRVRQDSRRQQRHPGQLAPQHLLPLLRPVQLADRDPCPALPAIGAGWGKLLGSVTIVYSTILCSLLPLDCCCYY